MYGDDSNLIFYIILAVAISLYVLWRKFSLGRLFSRTAEPWMQTSNDGSNIMAFFSSGYNLEVVHRDKLKDMRYSIFMTEPRPKNEGRSIPFAAKNSLIYMLDLSFNTSTHLVGLSKQYDINRLQFESFLLANNMEKVVLEGDFPDYFDIYATKGQGENVRYVLNPSAMAFVVDYCQNNFWEICNDEMYFVITAQDKPGGSVIDDSLKFVEHIKPALLPGDPGAAPVDHNLYGEYDGPALDCPICHNQMEMTDKYMSCGAGHGVLINAHNLEDLYHDQLEPPSLPNNSQTHDVIGCPNCQNLMEAVEYEGGLAPIDTCTHCPFRWLDMDDVEAIVKHHPEAA